MAAALLARLVLLLCALASVGCEDAPLVSDIDAPQTATEQVEALDRAREGAEAGGNWVRVEVSLLGLQRIAPHRHPYRKALLQARKRRAVAETLAEVESLLDVGAWRSARGRLLTLPEASLTAAERERHKRLLELSDTVEREASEIDELR